MHKQEISGSRSLDQIIWHADGNAETRTRVDLIINQLFLYFQGDHAADCFWPGSAGQSLLTDVGLHPRPDLQGGNTNEAYWPNTLIGQGLNQRV